MYNPYGSSPCPYYENLSGYAAYPCPYCTDMPMYRPYSFKDETEYDSGFDYLQSTNYHRFIPMKDYGPLPFAVNINKAAKQNNTFRTALWTGKHLQVTLMSINVGDDIGLEIHPNVDQFIRIEEGQALVRMGSSKDRLDFQAKAYEDFAIMVPAGTWHNVINTGNRPLKVYSIYAPPQHPHGTVHPTKAAAQASE
jgi:mannose-6-phosphate isomerase-like protein (cupin superfamily)